MPGDTGNWISQPDDAKRQRVEKGGRSLRGDPLRTRGMGKGMPFGKGPDFGAFKGGRGLFYLSF